MLDLKKQISSKISIIRNDKDMLIQPQSFGYKNGLPINSDFVFDARCLKNPYWDKRLRQLSGKNKKVSSFLNSDKSTMKMEKSIITFLEKWIPSFLRSDRHYLTISIGYRPFPFERRCVEVNKPPIHVIVSANCEEMQIGEIGVGGKHN